MTGKLMAWMPVLALPLLAGGWVVVNGTMGTCGACVAIMDSVTGQGSDKPASAAALDQSASAFELQAMDFEGQPVSLEKFAGKPMLIDFWATWCPPCRHQREILAGLQDQLKDKVTVLAVSVDDSPGPAAKYVADKGAIGEELFISSDLIARFEITEIPTLVFVDAAGQVQAIETGVHTAADIKSKVAKLSSPTIARSE